MEDKKIGEMFADFDKIVIKERLDELIKAAEKYNSLGRININIGEKTDILFHPIDEIELDSGIEVIAEKLGLSVKRLYSNYGDAHRFIYSFFYGGWTFIQKSNNDNLANKRMEGLNDT